MDFDTFLQVADGTVRLSIPLLLACLAGLFSERAGIFDIGLEGKMLAAAFLSAAVSAHFMVNPTGGFIEAEVCADGACEMVMQSVHYIPPVVLGLFAGIFASLLLAALHGLASITFRGDQLISGVAINFLASGLTFVIALNWFNEGARTPQLVSDEGARFTSILLPFADSMNAVPFVGPFYAEVVSGHSLLVYIAFATVPLSWWVLYRTRFGLRLRAVGENPAAVDTAGISVVGLRYSAVLIAGVLCGIAGAYLSTALQAGFTKDMTANRGFIALAALIFAKWRPWYALFACLLFGMFFAIDNNFQNIQVPALWVIAALAAISALLTGYAVRNTRLDIIVLGGFSAVLMAIAVSVLLSVSGSDAGLWDTVKLPTQLMQSLPYILTVVAVAGFVGKAIPPRAGGEPYVKER